MAGRPPSARSSPALSRTNTFLGDRYRRLARRRGKKRAIVAVGNSVLTIVWHLLSDPDARYHDLGPGYYESRINKQRRQRDLIRQLEHLTGQQRQPPTHRLTPRRPTTRPDPATPGAAACPLTAPIFESAASRALLPLGAPVADERAFGRIPVPIEGGRSAVLITGDHRRHQRLHPGSRCRAPPNPRPGQDVRLRVLRRLRGSRRDFSSSIWRISSVRTSASA